MMFIFGIFIAIYDVWRTRIFLLHNKSIIEVWCSAIVLVVVKYHDVNFYLVFVKILCEHTEIIIITIESFCTEKCRVLLSSVNDVPSPECWFLFLKVNVHDALALLLKAYVMVRVESF